MTRNCWAARHGLALLAIVTATGCATVAESETFTKPRLISVMTEGVTIYDEGGRWTLSGTDPVRPPFVGQYLSVDPEQAKVLDLFEKAMQRGARRVRVDAPGLKTPLYGVLALCPVNDNAQDSTTKRVYRVEVPASYVSQARGARISVVYQPYKVGRVDGSGGAAFGRMLTGRGAEDHIVSRMSWVLWLSDAPFAGHDPNWTAPSGEEKQ